MIVPPIVINDEVYHPILQEIVFYPPSDVKRKRKNKNKATERRRRKKQILYNQDPICFYCRRNLEFKESTIDHKVPRSKGGSNKLENFVIACRDCNVKKGNKSFEEFLEKRRSS